MDRPPLQPESAVRVPDHFKHGGDNQESGRVVITWRAAVGIYDIQSKCDRHGEVALRIHQMYGLTLPQAGKCSAEGPLFISSMGPGHWRMLNNSDDRTDINHELGGALAGIASVFDRSDAFTIFHIHGPNSRDVLAKGIHLDLDPDVFRAGSAAATSIAHINVLFWKLNEQSGFELAVPRSYATAFLDWLHESALEFRR